MERNAGTLQRPVPGQKAAGRMPLHADNDLQPVDDAPQVGMQPSQTRLGVELNGTLERPKTPFHAGALERFAMKFVGIVQHHDFFGSDFEMSTESKFLSGQTIWGIYNFDRWVGKRAGWLCQFISAKPG